MTDREKIDAFIRAHGVTRLPPGATSMQEPMTWKEQQASSAKTRAHKKRVERAKRSESHGHNPEM